MGAPRKHPPKNAAEIIQDLAAKGFSNIGIAKHLGVSKETVRRWLDDDEALQEAFEMGRETERQALHAAVYRSAMEGKPANVNAFFILKARFGYVEADNRSKVSVEVAVQNHVLIVTDHGTDAEWEAKAAEQQRKLMIDAEGSLALPKPSVPQASASHEQSTVVVPGAASWVAPAPAASPPASYLPPAPHAAPTWRGNA